MKKIDVLTWGVQHIASNYKMGADTDYQTEEQVCIYVTDEHPDVSPAPINDMQLLAQDLGIESDMVEVGEYGVTIWVPGAWVHTEQECKEFYGNEDDNGNYGKLLEDYVPTGYEMWKRYNTTIGEPMLTYTYSDGTVECETTIND